MRSRKKKPKIKLSTKKVMAMTAVIFVLCAALVVINALVSPESPSAGRKPEKVKTELTQKNENPAKTENSSVQEKPQNSTPRTAESRESVKNTTPASSEKKQNSAPAAPEKETDKSAEKKSGSVIKPEEPVASVKPVPPVEQEPLFNIPKAEKGATLVFIIDDAGLNVEYTKRYATLPFPITIAVLPGLPHTKDCAWVVRSNKKELILHQPMQSVNLKLDPGPGKITADMKAYDIIKTVRENLDELGPGVKGMNNHEGSLITSDVLKIGFVMDVCDERGIYFLDSRTTKDTQAPQAALERGTAFFEKNAPYIDNVIDRNAMISEIYKCLDVANNQYF